MPTRKPLKLVSPFTFIEGKRGGGCFLPKMLVQPALLTGSEKFALQTVKTAAADAGFKLFQFGQYGTVSTVLFFLEQLGKGVERKRPYVDILHS
jgi:hypothetical protein